mgnify:CR=1 FL=1
MIVKVLRDFYDVLNKHVLRKRGDVFECDEIRARTLVSGKYAEKVTEAAEAANEPKVLTQTTDYAKMSYKELQKLAKEVGIKTNQKKAKLIECLSNVK